MVQKQINEQIRGFNVKLREMADKIQRLHYCNTVPYLTDKDGPCPELYRKQEFDPNGVHLNDVGKMELAKAITEEFKRLIQRQSAVVKPAGMEAVGAGEAGNEVRALDRSSEIVCSEELNSSSSNGRHV